MNTKSNYLNETISLMALGSGIWEYYNITCMEDLKEAYRDFDERIAHDTDIELQYIDGCLSGYACSVFEEFLDLLEEYNEDIDTIKDLLNATNNIEETKRILDNECYEYYYGRNELDVFENYLYETDFFYDIPERIQCYIDIEKVRRDFYFIDIYSTDVFEKYLFIFG
ncbi:MAG: hypothetical protein IJY87_05295 [Bacilli bacterium]|nr:hypothetical protein [Bacilli bacterium]